MRSRSTIIAFVIAVSLLGKAQAFPLHIDSMTIDEAANELRIFGALTGNTGIATVNGKQLQLKQWATSAAVFALPFQGAGSSGPVIVTNGLDSVRGWTIFQWYAHVWRIENLVSNSTTTPQTYPPHVTTDWHVYFRAISHSTGLPPPSTEMKATRRSSCNWDCRSGGYFNYSFEVVYSGYGTYPWKALATDTGYGFSSYGFSNTRGDSGTCFFPGPSGATCRFEEWSIDRDHKQLLWSTSTAISLSAPPLQFAFADLPRYVEAVEVLDTTLYDFQLHRESHRDTLIAIAPEFDDTLSVQVEQPKAPITVSIWPNPSTRDQSVRIYAPSLTNDDIEVVDQLGRTVTRITTNAGLGTLQASGISPGPYQLISGEHKLGSVLFLQP